MNHCTSEPCIFYVRRLNEADRWDPPLALLIYVNGVILLTSRHSSSHHSGSDLNCIDVLFGETAYLTPRWALYLPPQGHLCRISLLSPLSGKIQHPNLGLLY